MNRTMEKLLKKPITATIVSIILGFIVAALILTAAGYISLIHPKYILSL